jgi:sialic acid synthase SpsE
LEEALGDGNKVPMPSEIKNMPIARRSLVARDAIRAGDIFTTETLCAKRPGTGISPMFYWEWLGRVATRDYEADELIDE